MPSKPVWELGLRERILAPAALVALPALAVLIYANVDRRQQAEETIIQSALPLARLAAVSQERLIEGALQLLTALSETQEVRRGTPEQCSAYLQQLLPRYGDTYNNLGVTDAEGHIVCSGIREASAVSITDRAYFTRAVASRSFAVGEYIVGRQTGRAALSFGYPIYEAGALKGVVYAALDLARLNESVIGHDWPPDVTLTVVERQGTIIARSPEGTQWIGRSLKEDPVLVEAGARPEGTIEREENGDSRLYAFASVRSPVDSGLRVLVSRSKTQALLAANRLMYEGLLAIAIVAVLVIVGVKEASDRLILRPLGQLVEASRRLAGGDLGARASSTTTIPELRELGEAFDNMAATLEEREAARLRSEMERKDLELQYHQSQKMDAVGRLAGGIAHDFNNMLTAILGYCELLLEDSNLNEIHRSDIDQIQRAGNTAAALTRQLLAFSRREIVEPTTLDLNSILAGMRPMLGRLIGEHIEIVTRLASDIDGARADRGQIEQVILNLVVNARDAMPNGGRIVIDTSNVHLNGRSPATRLGAEPGDYVMLEVADTGTGMPAEVQAHLFEPFFTTKKTGKGTGLGLATVYGVVRQSGGAIEVESEVNRGSSFRIYFPSVPRAQGPSELPRETASRPSSTETILVVEDDASIREMTCRILSRDGYAVISAGNGDGATKICAEHTGPIDLLVSDVVMPGMNGPAVAQALSKMRPGLKVIYMSGYTDDAIVRHGVFTRDVPFLQKPFTPEQLMTKVREVLEARS